MKDESNSGIQLIHAMNSQHKVPNASEEIVYAELQREERPTISTFIGTNGLPLSSDFGYREIRKT